MSPYRSLRTALLWTALIALASYAVAAESVLVALVTLPLAWGAWWAADRPWSSRVPRLAINAVLLLVVAMGLGLALLTGQFNVERVAEMLAALLIIKLFDRRTARDSAEVVALAVFLAFGAILTSLKLSVGLFILLFCPLLVWTALLQQVVAADERASRYQADLGAVARRRAAGGGTLGRGLRRMTGGLTLAASVIAAAVFVLVPRGVAPGFLDVGDDRSTITQAGFADEVQLGRAGLISDSPQIVLDLAVEDADGASLGASGRTYYLRGAVLDHYENGRWSRHPRGQSNEQARTPDSQGRVYTGPADNRAVVRQEVTLRKPPTRSAFIYAIQQPFLWTFGETLELRYDQSLGTMRLAESATVRTYEVMSALPGARGMDLHADGQRRRTRPLADFPSERVAAVTRAVLEEAGVDAERRHREPREVTRVVRALLEHFQGFEYTTDIQRARGEPIEWFLDTARRGHCEYFASAMAAMCRSVGINARVVTGYVAVEYSDASRSYTVRESNAHAWVEVEHAQRQWRTHDPTPPADFQRVHAPEMSLGSMVRRWMDAVEFFWIDSVVTFDRGAQQRVLGAQGEQPQINALRRLADVIDRIRGSGWVGFVQAALAGVIAFCGVFALAIAGQAVLRRLGLGALPRSPRVRVLGGAGDLGVLLLRTLARAGHAKPAWKPLLAHVSDLPADAQTENSLVPIVRRLYEARFGGRPIAPDEAQSLRRRVLEAADQLRSGPHAPQRTG